MKKCNGCAFYKSLSSGNSMDNKACHHYLLTGIRRKIGENGQCLSVLKKDNESKAYIDSLSKKRREESLFEI